MPNTTTNAAFYTDNVSTAYLDYAGIARNQDASVPERIIDRIAFDSISFQPVNWESLSNAAATTTYSPYELADGLRRNDQIFGGTSSIDIDDIMDAVSRSTRTLNRFNRNQAAQLEMTIDKPSEYLFDILDGRYGVNDVKPAEPRAVPIPKEKLLEVLLAE